MRLTEAECIDYIIDCCTAGDGGWVVTPNLDILRQCDKDEVARGIAEEAEVVVADGMPLIWASRLQRTPLPERVCGSNVISSLSARAAEKGLSIYLLGGADDAADRAAEVLSARHPRLRVCGTYSPPFGFESDDEEIERMASMVKAARPDIIFVALGFPKGELLIRRIRHARRDAWWIGVGISFSFVAGIVQRAPPWMQRLGLEWSHRLLQEPRRLAKRYLVHDVPYAIRLWLSCAWKGIRGR